MFGQPYAHPYYRNYPPNVSYNPYLQSSNQPSSTFDRPRRPDDAEDEDARARVLAQRRAKRAQYLPDEAEDDDDMYDADDWYAPRTLTPKEKLYLEAKRRQGLIERQRREEAEALERERERERKWQEELEKRKIDDEERRRVVLEAKRKEMQAKREEAERRARAQQQRRANSPSMQGDNSVPINRRRSRAPSVASQTLGSEANAEPESQKQPPVEPEPIRREYTEADHEAASRIQQRYRIHRSLKALEEVRSQFETLKNNFAYPSVIDFVKPGATLEQQEHGEGGHVTVRATRPPSDFTDDAMDVDCQDGKLAYTSTNYALHQYSDGMDKLLMKLDGIESWGKKVVRQRRRDIVKEIEREARRLDWYWKEAWKQYNSNN